MIEVFAQTDARLLLINKFIMTLSHYYQGPSKLITNQPPDFRKVIIREDIRSPPSPNKKNVQVAKTDVEVGLKIFSYQYSISGFSRIPWIL